MKERQILMSAPMVRSTLDGSKTQTRRVFTAKNGEAWPNKNDIPGMRQILRSCPYGQPGDRLWVRETHAPQADCWGSWERWERGEGGPKPIIHYAADFKPYQDGQGFTIHKPFIEKWRPSIHMPRWASRITLEITGVRVERLQDISEADAIAEGIQRVGDGWERFHVDPDAPAGQPFTRNPVLAYRGLWESINGPGSWDANPWVWSVTFQKVTP